MGNKIKEVLDILEEAYLTEDNRRKKMLCDDARCRLINVQQRIDSLKEEVESELRYAEGGILLDKWLDSKREELLQQKEAEALKDPE